MNRETLPFAGGALLVGAILVPSTTLSSDGTALINNTIRLSLAWYFVALFQMMQLHFSDWQANSLRGRIARWSWTWAVVCYLLHVAAAFHYFHNWSHDHAYSHTQEVGGFGAGIYASYCFTILWTADALWWWIAPDKYTTRSSWFDRCLHAFMLFMTFNATVVFESGAVRWLSLIAFSLLAVALYHRRANRFE